jgi:2-amino-4-hydroxy-6-hydroxymethyldihydropteridine diphosphokinase
VPRVYVSIGSNVEREKNIRGAVDKLRAQFGDLTISPVYESEAVGFVGNNFLNLVVGFDTDLSLAEITKLLRAIERKHGRVRGDQKFSDRTLDLDPLLYGDLIDHFPPNNVPRHEIGQYAFVLRPLSDIAGQARHPETGERFANMWSGFEANGQRLWDVELEL